MNSNQIKILLLPGVDTEEMASGNESQSEYTSSSSSSEAVSDFEFSIDGDDALFSPNARKVVDSIYNDFSDENIGNCVTQCLDDLVNAIHNGVPSNPQKLVRKRRRRISVWVIEKRKKACQSGKSFINSKGQVRPSKTIKNKKPCESCRFKGRQ